MSRQWRSDDTSKWLEGFGLGGSGTSYAVPANEGCSGTISTTTLTLATAGTFANGDLVLIHQTRGTGTGTWELNKITSGGGTTTLTMAYTLKNAYTDSGANQAQVIEMNQYNGMTTGAITAPAWDGSKGGILAWFDKGTTTIDNTITITGRGFLGGPGADNVNRAAYKGEGTPGLYLVPSPLEMDNRAANGNGGGGGAGSSVSSNHPTGGGGGGHGASGQAGQRASGAGGTGGSSVGNANLTSANFGGGGGGCDQDGTAPAGGSGGGMCFVFSKNIIITGGITLNGNTGAISSNSYGGTTSSAGGAGGSCLLKCETATLGSSLITSSGGSQISATWAGGAGAVGRIHLDYSGSYTGTTSPTIDVTLDATIIEGGSSNSSSFFLLF